MYDAFKADCTIVISNGLNSKLYF